MDERRAATLQELLDQAVQDPAVPGAVLRVDAGWRAVRTWRGAAGHADPATRDPMRPEHPFLAASVTKLITASTALCLVEEGTLDLDAPITSILGPALTAGFGPAITARHLLSHTSGLPDYFNDGVPLADGRQPFVALMRDDPERLWDPREVIDWVRANLTPKFAPGAGWHYADTNFVLAGLIIEAVEGQALHEVMRRRIFDPAGMDATYMPFREPARGRLAPSVPYAGSIAHNHRAVSADWAGGGLVTTVDDLARFLRKWWAKDLFREERTMSEMLRWTSTGETGCDYGLGVRRFDLDALGWPGCGALAGHTGFIKSFAFVWPHRALSFCGTLNQSSAKGVFSEVRPVAALVRRLVESL